MNPRDPTQQGDHRRMFDESVDDLDQATANRLRLMRRETLSTRPASGRRRLLPVATFALAALALGLGWRLGGSALPGDTGDAASVPTSEAEISQGVPSDEDTALYAWLGEAPVAADGKAL
jgi:hypothetical protein